MTIGGRSTSGRTPVGRPAGVVEPARTVVEASQIEGVWQVHDPAAPRVVEVHSADHETLYVLEPVAVGPDGGRAAQVLGELLDVDDPAGLAGPPGVLTRVAGGKARFVALPDPPAPPPVPQRYEQRSPALRWQHVHDLGYRPVYECHTSDGLLIKPENVEHPVPGSVSEIVFGAPVQGYADPA